MVITQEQLLEILDGCEYEAGYYNYNICPVCGETGHDVDDIIHKADCWLAAKAPKIMKIAERK